MEESGSAMLRKTLSNCESIYNEVGKRQEEQKSADFSNVFDIKNKDADLDEFKAHNGTQLTEQDKPEDMGMSIRM